LLPEKSPTRLQSTLFDRRPRRPKERYLYDKTRFVVADLPSTPTFSHRRKLTHLLTHRRGTRATQSYLATAASPSYIDFSIHVATPCPFYPHCPRKVKITYDLEGRSVKNAMTESRLLMFGNHAYAFLDRSNPDRTKKKCFISHHRWIWLHSDRENETSPSSCTSDLCICDDGWQ
jgi:hypothetical protein